MQWVFPKCISSSNVSITWGFDFNNVWQVPHAARNIFTQRKCHYVTETVFMKKKEYLPYNQYHEQGLRLLHYILMPV